MTDEEIAGRVLEVVKVVFRNWPKPEREGYSFATQLAIYLDDAEDYRLAFVLPEWHGTTKRQMKRVRKLVFARLRIVDPAVVEK